MADRPYTMALNRRYIATLAAAAISTLAVGLFVKRRLRVEPVTALLPTEASALQQLSQEGQVRRLSSFLDERTATLGRFAEYVTATSASGLRWRVADSLVTTSAEQPVFVVASTGADPMRVAPLATSDSLRGQWALIVARAADGGLVSAAGIVGGRARTSCGPAPDVTEYLIGVPLHDGLAGAGVFDLDGRLRGVVARCSGRLAALPVSTVMQLLAAPSLGDGSSRLFGAIVRPIDDVARRYFGIDSGLLVTEVGRSTRAASANWAPGDVLVQVGAESAEAAIARAGLDSLRPTDTVRVTLMRSGRRIVSTMLPEVAGAVRPTDARSVLGLELEEASVAGARIERVATGSPAHAAGLRPGDRLLRIGNLVITTPAAAQRALDRASQASQPTFLTFERDSLRRGAFILP